MNRLPGLIVALLVGVLAGAGGYTFQFARGLSYFSNDPKACVNCHAMNDTYDGWQKASHHAAATCNDCHLPHALVPKLIAKGRNGYNHSRAFTLQNYPETIRVHEWNAAILESNCLRCHEQMAGNAAPVHGVDLGSGCVHCHRGVGHGPVG